MTLNLLTVLRASAAMAALAAAAPSTHAQVADWRGLYFGGSAGLIAADGEDREIVTFDTDLNGGFGDTVRTQTGVNAFNPGFCSGFAYGRTPAEGCRDDLDENLLLALKAGYDWQFGSFVVGALGEVTSANIGDDVSAFSTTPASYTFTRDVNYLAALRARLGYTVGDGLFYATGGGVWADIDHGFSTTNTANSFTAMEPDDNWGYQFGGGFEFLLREHVSFGLEYLFSTIKDEDHVVMVGPGTAPVTNPFRLVNPSGTAMRREDDEIDIHQFGLTLNWRM